MKWTSENDHKIFFILRSVSWVHFIKLFVIKLETTVITKSFPLASPTIIWIFVWSINSYRCGLFQFNWEQCVTAMLCFDMLSTQNISTHTQKKTALKNPWRSHFCIRGENLPEDDDEQSVERRFYIYGCDSVCPNKKVILHCHHSWRITFCSDSKTNTQSELLHSLDKIETKKEQVIQDELINCALWKIYLCMTVTSNSDVVGSQNAMKS